MRSTNLLTYLLTYLHVACSGIQLRLPHVSFDINQLNFGRANLHNACQQVYNSLRKVLFSLTTVTLSVH